MNDVGGIPQYPWSEGDTVFASALNAAIGNAGSASTGAINAKDYGASGDGVTNDSAAIQAAINAAAAANTVCFLPKGVYIVEAGLNLSPTSGLKGLVGAGRYATIIRRISGDTVSPNYLIYMNSGAQIEVASLTLDGNKANVPAGSAGAGICCFTSSSIRINDVAVINQNGNPNYGWGIYIDACSDFSVVNCEVKGCTFGILGAVQGSDILIANDVVKNNTTGINFGDSATVAKAFYGVTIAGNVVSDHVGNGIGVGGFIPGTFDPSTVQQVTITGNSCINNGTYGIVVQATDITVSGNVAGSNGTASQPYGGILCNSVRGAVTGNTVTTNIGFGIDAGGSQGVSVRGNEISGTTNGAGVNLGSSIYCTVSNNTFTNNAPATGSEISLHHYDSGGGAAIPITAGYNVISDNTFIISATTTAGIYSDSSPPGLIIKNNTFIGGSENQLISCVCRAAVIQGNRWLNAPSGSLIAAAATVVFPQYTDIIGLTGASATITRITSSPTNTFGGLITTVDITNRGSNYTSPPTLTISGNGTGAVAVAMLDGQGHVANIQMTNWGTGYTTATVSASGGGGSGFAGTPVIGDGSMDGRLITVNNWSGNPQTIANNANIQLAGGANLVLPNGAALVLHGVGSALYEVASGGYLPLTGGTVSGALEVTGVAGFGDGVNFNNILAASPTDLTKHVSLYAGTYGLCASNGQTNLNAPAGAAVVFNVGGVAAGACFGSGLWSVGLQSVGGMGLFGGGVVATKPTVTGAKGGNLALASLLTALASYGLILDSSAA